MSLRLARSAGVIGVATLASRLLGLARQTAIAVFLAGTPAALDAYYVAVRLPSLLRDLFAEGAMSAAFVPTFARHLHEGGRDAAWRLASQVINALLLVTGAFVLLGILFAEPLVNLYVAEEFASTPGLLDLTVRLTRVTMPFLALIALAAVFMGMLNAMRQFFLPALSPAMFNVALILAAASSAWVASTFGVAPIYGLAVGFVLGGFGQMAVQWPALRRAGFRHRWILDVRDRGLREVLALMGPGTLGQAAAQVNLAINIWLATSQPIGSVTYLTFAFTYMYLPIGVFSVSVSTASIPDLAVHAGARAWDEMRRVISAALRLMLMLSVPSCVGLVVLAVPIIEMTLEYGDFTHEQTLGVAAALMAYAPGLMGYSLVKIASPSFYAMQDARTPLLVSVVTVIVNIVLNLTLVRVMGYTGLALGTATASVINAALLLYMLSGRIGGIDGARVLRTATKITVASLVMGVAVWATDRWLAGVPPVAEPGGLLETVAGRAVRVFGAIGVGIATLALVAHALRLEEFRQVTARVLARLRR
jgi:putative peptidoglycan lipid II flippase